MDALDRLAEQVGMQLAYTDVWGKPHEASHETKKALLVAMGFAADDETTVTASLAAFERQAWQRLLPPVVVRRQPEPPVVPIILPEVEAGQWVEWRLETEQGGRYTGGFSASECEALAHASVDGVAYVRYGLRLEADLPIGYHRLAVKAGWRYETTDFILAPATCHQPDVLAGDGRVYGLSAQLYALRSGRNWGIGDFTDLATLIDQAAELGADLVGLNPLHALFPDNPAHRSPYSPSSRLFFNVLYLDVEGIPEFAESEAAQDVVKRPEFQTRLAGLRSTELVDYPQVAALKLSILELLYQTFRTAHVAQDTPRAQAFREYVTQGGEALRRHTRYDALQAHFRAQDQNTWGWPVWPEAYRDPYSEAVLRFAEEYAERVEFYQYLQWQTHEQLTACREQAKARGLGVGVYLDLAVSVDRAGAETWGNQSLYALAVSIGAPPDVYNLKGQSWGLPAPIPYRLVESGYRLFIETLRQNMRYAGALRIDHVMALLRLYWVPEGRTPVEGTYVHYPLQDLLGILALESVRHQCLVIGEDLGTVPDEVRKALPSLGVLSYRLLYFEKDQAQRFMRPADYPRQALVAVSTHDLPTLAGFWEGTDLQVRRELDLFPSPDHYEQAVAERATDRAHLLAALDHEDLLSEGATLDPASMTEMTDALAAAVHRYVARTPSEVMLIQLEDMCGQHRAVNLPGTTDQHPNWQRRLPVLLEELRAYSRVRAINDALQAERGRAALAQRAAGHVEHFRVIPRCTYRMQFNKHFTFADATALIPYLKGLGVSHVYASPYLKARPGSTHGYDIVDHNTINPEIGDMPSYQRFVDELKSHEMGQVLDIVPNHMGVMGSDNAWWLDVLENGQASIFAGYFDIDWYPLKPELTGKILLPVLGDHYGLVLERGELTLKFDPEKGALAVYYYEHVFPVDPHFYPVILRRRMDVLETQLGLDNLLLLSFQSLMTAFEHLPDRVQITPEGILERHRDKELHKRHLAELCAGSEALVHFITENLAQFNGQAGELESFQALHKLLDAQAYRLAFWRVAADEINYRRFFDINDLAGLRMEDERVFEATHRFVLDQVAEGKIEGLRIDHPDGLYDPAQYLSRLQSRVMALARRHPEWGGQARPVYLVVEKILAGFEYLPESWPVAGSSGYEFVNLITGLFVDPSAERRMSRAYDTFTGDKRSFDEILYQSKKQIIEGPLSSELSVLASRLSGITESDLKTRDYTLIGIRDALAEVVAAFPVYRTYITGAPVSEIDRRYIDRAVARARKHAQADQAVFDLVHDALLLKLGGMEDAGFKNALLGFVMKFQQYTAPVTAKGLEDTAFYNYHRLVSLNEVGGDPRRFGVPVNDFHHLNQERNRLWRHALLGSTTHDTKRSEDVRARINVLSEMPEEWRRRAARWSQLNRAHKRKLGELTMPSKHDEYLLYQTLVGSWPFEDMEVTARETYRDRIQAYMVKAAREAKANTAWVNVNAAYEEALEGFIQAILEPGPKSLFLEDFVPFARRVAQSGLYGSLSMTLLKLTCPGVPDIYQGNELWDLSLVDPDNRRPVDYAQRMRYLTELEEHAGADQQRLVDQVTARMADGRIKLYLIWRTLAVRARHERLFQRGDYLPLSVEGERSEHVVAFARIRRKDQIAIVVAPRLVAKLGLEPKGDGLARLLTGTEVIMPPNLKDLVLTHAFTGERIEAGARLNVAGLLARFPVALLTL